MKSDTVRLLVLSVLIACYTSAARAQDSFEVQVYESDLVPVDHSELDVHTLFIERGSTSEEGTVAPSDQQAHMAFEFTRGVTDYFEMGSYLLFAHRPGYNAEYAGFRLRPRVRAPEEWGLPVGLSLSTEIGFPQLQYEPNHVTLEIRPIIDKKMGRWKFDINPIMTFAFNGPEASEGMGLEPEMKVGYDIVLDQFTGELEYYTALGPAHHLLPYNRQVHLFYPKLEYDFSEFFVINAGVGIGLSNASDPLTWAVRFTFNM